MFRKLFSVLTIFAALAAPAFATSVASLNGNYKFQVPSISTQYGYWSGSTWVPVSGSCPSGQTCVYYTFQQVAQGGIQFDGAGNVEFTGFSQYPSGGSGPQLNTQWTYSLVATYEATFNGVDSQGNSFTVLVWFGDFNSAGVATSIQFIVNPTSPSNIIAGTGILKGNTN